ncbi:hypothetical protein [Paenibacillus sp. MER 99-2]|uniref:hypothetical protein n=1 Tax=Paenibacillus sp. MER 99-2 TaxID=2939572 RepID=UPI00203DAB7D|nr:hypothetical protein [Paenibacillus sp. MER 99-2]MCM3174402.1 hypothetical protein [Paenibacillus sp. MER 99-2]
MNEQIIYKLIQDAFVVVNEVPSHSDSYMLGILMNDLDTLQHIKVMEHMQAIVMQSLQVNHSKRALWYLVAIRKMRKKYGKQSTQLRDSLTEKLQLLL